ncbi:hypothetical protein PN462_13445 [Spirulina sp. CS-785/01]|uniref:hypothetical protein n=1 Tax=Spirulina sp. CS-785/01 TaxID=3021716 RepID=UPI00232C32D4|nr:hypothetical protein [Spirulina sp. CS-785/01]MDB9314110.1 hypothetical protein [Spirulina sp. CS-785/01]
MRYNEPESLCPLCISLAMNWFKWFRKPQPQDPPQPVDMDDFVAELLRLVKRGMTRDDILQVLESRHV